MNRNTGFSILLICLAGIAAFSCGEETTTTPRPPDEELLFVTNFSNPMDLEAWQVHVTQYGSYDLKYGLLELETGQGDELHGDLAHIFSVDSWEIAENDTYYVTVRCRVFPSDNVAITIIGAVCTELGGYMGYDFGFGIRSSSSEQLLQLAAMGCRHDRSIEQLPGLYEGMHEFMIKLCKSTIWYYYDDVIIDMIESTDECTFNIDVLYLAVRIGSLQGGHAVQIDRVKLKRATRL
jgi:hypothetical protein